jgi:predicted phosphohydrolase
MKIQYCSDLHLEFRENKKFLQAHPLSAEGEILLLAGDIIPFAEMDKHADFFSFVSYNFEHTYWLPGNHEYYNYTAFEKSGAWKEQIKSNVWLVNNQTLTHKNINFIFTTLWSKISPINALDIQRSVSDFFVIKWQQGKFTTRQFNELHRNSISFLQNALKENEGATNIVVTHHVPTLFHYPQQYKSSPLNEAFATELHDLVYDSNAAYWIYGHHHVNVPEFTIGKTAMLTNQLGYVSQHEQKGFRTNAIIEI